MFYLLWIIKQRILHTSYNNINLFWNRLSSGNYNISKILCVLRKHVAKIWNANHIEANSLEMLFFLLLNSNTIQHIYCIAPTTVLQLRQRVERKKVWQWLINQICHVTFLKRSASFQKLIKTRNDRQHSYEHFLRSNFTPHDKLQISWHYV